DEGEAGRRVVLERLLGDALQARVEGQDDVVARDRRHEARPDVGGQQLGGRGVLLAVAVRVDDEALDAALAAEVVLPLLLDAVAADRVPLLVALAAPLLELDVADLIEISEDVGRELAVEVVPVRRVADLDAGQELRLLRDERQPLARHVLEDQRRVGAVAGARDLLGHVLDLVDGEVEELREAGARVGRERARHDEDVERRPVVDEDVAAAVHDLAAHRRNPGLGTEVVRRLLEVALAAHDLELPEPADEDHERGRDDGHEPAEARVELGHAGGWDVAVALQHQVRYPSRSASRSRCVRAKRASTARQRRKPAGASAAVSAAEPIMATSWAPSGATGASNMSSTRRVRADAPSAATSAKTEMKIRPRTSRRGATTRARMQTVPSTSAPIPRGAPARTSWT